MKVSGFTIVRNAINYDYPVTESIRSLLPLCDEVIVAVGKSDDDTLGLVGSIQSDKIKIIETVWDDNLRKGGQVLAVETNKALKQIAADSDWAMYLQADEVLNETDIAAIQAAMRDHLSDEQVQGLLFDYLHFYGSYDIIADGRQWYRHEVRVIRNGIGVSSYGDAMGFRINDNKLKVKGAHASVYHYGWVKHPKQQQAKQDQFHKMWHSDQTAAAMAGEQEEFDYSNIDSFKPFKGNHPAIMHERIAQKNWEFLPPKPNPNFKEKLSMGIEKLTGHRVGEYKNYKLI